MTSLANTPKSLGLGNILGTTLPTPMEKPQQPTSMGIEGGWADQVFTKTIPGHGIGAGKLLDQPSAKPVTAQKAKNQKSQSDALNFAEVRRIKDRNAAKQATKSTILMGERFV